MPNDYLISVIYPDYEIATGSPGATRLGSGTLDLGHTGFAYVNGQTGQIRYFDYGRYSGTEGVIRETLIASGTGFTHIDLNALDGGYAPGLGAALSEASGYTGNIQFNVFEVADGSFETLNQRIDPDIGNPNGFYGEWTFFNTCHNFVQDMSQLVGVDLDGSDGFAATPRGSAEALRDNLGGVLYNPETGVHWEVQSEQGMIDYFVDLLESGAVTFQEMIQLINSNGDAYMNGLVQNAIQNANNNCFLGDTPISMWPLDPNFQPGPDGIYDQDEVRAKIWTKPISEIRVKDLIVAHDKDGNLVPDVVSRTFQNEATHILDFWGTGVTPGHAYLCGDGKREGEYAPLIDILRQDGAIVLENGTKVRAAINWPVGSLPDQFIWVLAGHDDGQKIQVTDTKQVRIGTRMIAPDGSDDCILDRLVHTYGPLSEDGYFENGTNVRSLVIHWPYGDKIPNPEDYILQRSVLTLEEIYAANEWEQIGTRMPAPSSVVGLSVNHSNSQGGMMLQPSKPAPNVPPAFADRPDVPKLNRKQRKALEARKRKTARVNLRKLQ